MIPQFSLTDLVNAFNALLPDWLAFSRDGSSRQSLITGWLVQLKVIFDLACGMPAATFPATTTTVIDAWNSSLNLPDPLIPAVTVAEQQAQITARLTGDISPTPANFQLFVANLLMIPVTEVTINQFLPFYMNFSRMNVDHFAPGYVQFDWQVIIPIAYASQVSFVTAELLRISPAQTSFVVLAE